MNIYDSMSMNYSYNEKCGENQNAHFMFSNLFLTIVPSLRYGTCTLLAGYLRLCTRTQARMRMRAHTHTYAQHV